MDEQPDYWQLIAQGETLKQEGLRLAKKYPQHAPEILALIAKGEMMRALLAESLAREASDEDTPS